MPAMVGLWDTEPLRLCHEARRASDALRLEGEQLVVRLLTKLRDSTLVARLRDDENLIGRAQTGVTSSTLKSRHADA